MSGSEYVGVAMMVALFLAAFLIIAKGAGLRVAITIFSACVVLTVWVVVAARLIGGGGL